jgi:uncharacterized SAM-binding protein YcdF (DUF218 family)
VNATFQEAQALIPYIEEHHWHEVAIVTSDYHTRRAGILRRRAEKERNSGAHTWIDGVVDPKFQQRWWHYRQSAKIWFMESLKLAWSMLRRDLY